MKRYTSCDGILSFDKVSQNAIFMKPFVNTRTHSLTTVDARTFMEGMR